MRINLPRERLEKAVAIGCQKRLDSIHRGLTDRRCQPGGWDMDINGAIAEEAAAMALEGLGWLVRPGPESGRGFGKPDLIVVDPQEPAVGFRVQVRSTSRRDGGLILHEWDKPNSLAVLVVGEYPNLSIPGTTWIPRNVGDFLRQYGRQMPNPRGRDGGYTAVLRQEQLLPIGDWSLDAVIGSQENQAV